MAKDPAKVYLFIPFSRPLVDACEDLYFTGTIGAFTGVGNAKEQVRYPASTVTFDTKKLEGSEAFTTKILENKSIEWLAPDARRKYADPMFAQAVKASNFGGSLRDVRADEVLFVAGHSSYTGGWLSLKAFHKANDTTTITYYQMRVDRVAELLECEGLPKTHRFVKLNSCYGGGSAELDRALAKDLAIELKKRGYLSIQVGGYQFLTVTGGGNFALKAPMLESKDGKPKLDIVKVPAELSKREGYANAKIIDPVMLLQFVFKPSNNPPNLELLYETDPLRVWYNGSGTCIRWNAPDVAFERLGQKPKLTSILDAKDERSEAFEARQEAELEWLARLVAVELAAKNATARMKGERKDVQPKPLDKKSGQVQVQPSLLQQQSQPSQQQRPLERKSGQILVVKPEQNLSKPLLNAWTSPSSSSSSPSSSSSSSRPSQAQIPIRSIASLTSASALPPGYLFGQCGLHQGFSAVHDEKGNVKCPQCGAQVKGYLP